MGVGGLGARGYWFRGRRREAETLSMFRRLIRAGDLDRFVETIVFTDEYGPRYGKPHARSFASVQARTGRAGHEHVYIADNYIADNPRRTSPVPARWDGGRCGSVAPVHSGSIGLPTGGPSSRSATSPRLRGSHSAVDARRQAVHSPA